MRNLEPLQNARLARSALVVICLLVLGVGLAIGAMITTSEIASAQTTNCPLGSCDFACLNDADAWTQSLGEGGVWVIVHAKPAITGTQVTPLVWRDTTSNGTSFPPMKVEGLWKESNGTGTVTAWVQANDDGSCSETGDANDWIRCHDGVVINGDDDHLCDSYPGIWGPVAVGGSGGANGCYSEYEMAYDFLKEFEYNGSSYCFQYATLTAKKPANTGTPYDGLKARSNCTALSSKAWDRDNSVVVWDCGVYSQERPGGSSSRLDVDLLYLYK